MVEGRVPKSQDIADLKEGCPRQTGLSSLLQACKLLTPGETGGVALAHFLLPLCVFFSFLQSAKPEIKCKRNSWADTPPFRAMPYHWFESLERIALSTPVIQSIFLGEQ